MSHCALEVYLKPLQVYLNSVGVTDLCINKPHEVWVAVNHRFTCYQSSTLTLEHLETLVELLAEFNGKSWSSQYPILSGILPQGERIECVRYPACEKGKIVLAIRKQQTVDRTLADYAWQTVTDFNHHHSIHAKEQELAFLVKTRKWYAFLKKAIRYKKNIMIAAGTGIGKTTFLNACAQHIARHERIITLESEREVKLNQPNCVHLLIPKENQSIAKTTISELFESCLRLFPHRILLSELRGQETTLFLEAIQSGHPGTLTTIHADSVEAAFEQLYLKCYRAGYRLDKSELSNYLIKAIPIVVQLTRHPQHFVFINEIYYRDITAETNTL